MRGRTTRAVAATLAIVGLALGLTACGGSGDDATTGSASNPQRFDLDLDWYVNPDHVGIYSALHQGYFKQAGLDVHPHVPSDPSAPIKEVAAGRADLDVVGHGPDTAHAVGCGVDALGPQSCASDTDSGAVVVKENA